MLLLLLPCVFTLQLKNPVETDIELNEKTEFLYPGSLPLLLKRVLLRSMRSTAEPEVQQRNAKVVMQVVTDTRSLPFKDSRCVFLNQTMKQRLIWPCIRVIDISKRLGKYCIQNQGIKWDGNFFPLSYSEFSNHKYND